MSANTQPLVSIVIPCYNGELFVGEAIASCTNQTYDRIEIVCVDDGSTDHSRSTIHTFMTDRRVKYHYQENMGLSAARNTGMRLAKGEFIHLLDADDILHPDKIETGLK